jgi:molybdopterin synthase catalytic subunit
MKVEVRLFARYREAAGRDRVEIDLPEGRTKDGVEAVSRRFPALGQYRPFTLFALREDYVSADQRLGEGDELCLFPPVSGGSGGEDWIEVTAEVLSEMVTAEAVGDPGAGAIALFSGIVRDQTGGRRVKFLEYEAHAPMALAKMREIAAAIRARWPGTLRVALVHRVGRLEIGESSVMIAVSSPHRREAFEACHFAIDTLKRRCRCGRRNISRRRVWVELQSECDQRH